MSRVFERRAGRGLAVLAGLVFAALLFVAVTVPYHATDALLFGRWSRLIGMEGGFELEGLNNAFYHRPFFYVVQGWMWHLFGYSDWSGRVLSLLFAALLAVSLVGIARALRGPWVVGGIAVALLLATPDYIREAAAGQTDILCAAFVAAAGWMVWRRPATWWTLALAATFAACAGLSKPSAYAGLAGLVLAAVVVDRRERLAQAGAVCAGTALALLYAVWQAGRFDQSVSDFLRGGAEATTAVDRAAGTYFAAVNDQMRKTVVLSFEWLGPYLVVPLLFALAYGVIRACGAAHRRAAGVAWIVALAGSVLLPIVAEHWSSGQLGPWHADRPAAALASLVLLGALWFAREASPAYVPDEVTVRRLVVWLVIPTLAWVLISPSTTRYLSPAWPGILLLMAWCLGGALDALAARRTVLAVVALVAIVGVAVADLRNLDALGTRTDGSISATRAVRELGVAGWFDRERALRAADPDLAALVEQTRAAMGPGDTLVTADSRLAFFFPGRVRNVVPERCEQLAGADVFVLNETQSSQLDARGRRDLDPETARLVFDEARRDPRRWARCTAPRLRELGQVPGVFVVYRVEPGA